MLRQCMNARRGSYTPLTEALAETIDENEEQGKLPNKNGTHPARLKLILNMAPFLPT
jgi:hypothetical protein